MEAQTINKDNCTLMGLLKDLNLNISTNPKGTDKGDYKNYIGGFYETEFAARKTKNNRLLEIGVRTGASIALWANFFKDIEIIGIDVEEVGTPSGPVKDYLEYPSVKFFCKDAYTQEFANSLTGNFSILIDDGPHSLSSQLKFLELYLPKLDRDGVLIIEDMKRAYRDSQQLANALPKGNKYLFETYDFRSLSKTGDDFVFVVRHNNAGVSTLGPKLYVNFRSAVSWMAVPFRRLKRALS